MSRTPSPRHRLVLRFTLRRVGLGGLLGIGLAGALGLLGLVTGVYRTGGGSMPVPGTVLWLLPLAALIEELLFRRLALEWTARWFGRWPALLATGLLFGLLHLSNPGGGLPALIGVTLAGIWLGQLYLQHRRIIAGSVAHWAWNAGIGPVLGLPVSGIRLGSLLGLDLAREGVASGGAFGPEASPLAWAVFATAIAGLEIHHRWTRHAR